MSQRTEQVEANLQKIIAEIISRDIELPQDHLVTVTRVSIAPDLKNATIFVSILPFDSAQDVLPLLDRQRTMIQQEMAKHVEMKSTPVLRFQLDKTNEEASEMERLIDAEMGLFDL